ncbi:MAG: HAD-IC family P-type ATPase [Gammaproteobacteria bacterium]|jgi:magnesium-transporting ATPase (P-type)|nr:HAD-IC family P-type ATPase [Gammaproteobacteria bacterium]MBT3858487.1 HAD-IC family P-type ATPase [Gammaproteobacteria bacterium]MBT3986775.1 HAD-IC family P-type ATPase [Gammaproteobacteria bacterium]MBT4582871.1 HAD-IC family P-type ATPase [Gammaproteobacteria bacterium]MBT4657594.1 HAD-IC family P-type ATPase [Gammaproteobacteria bacterium]
MTDENGLLGLSQSEAELRLQQYGPNSLPAAKKPSLLQIFAHQYKSPFIYVLLAAALVSLALGQIINCVFIFLVLLLNASIGTFQEYAAQQAALGLEKMVPLKASVYRDGKPIIIDAGEVVPGDLVMLVSGDKVPADIRIVELQDLHIDESMLTGESIAAEKNIDTESSDATSVGDRLDMAFAGTMVMRGRAKGEVTTTGLSTEIGKIVSDVSTESAAQPPLMQRMHAFTMRVTYAMLILISVIFLITLLRGDDLQTVFFLGVALAVSAIPEGLPVAITVALAIGMRRMAKSGVIIRNLVAVESLGSCTLIASDKTGTLTVNEMTIQKVQLADGSEYSISGEGTDLHGQISREADGSTEDIMSNENLRLLIDGSALANEAYLEDTDSGIEGHGDAVDLAFLILAEKSGSRVDTIRKSHTELGNIPYESQNAFAASLNRHGENIELFVKGSVECLLEMCSYTEQGEALQRKSGLLARQGYRVLGIAHRRLETPPNDLHQHLHNLELLGVVGMIDPLRPEVIEAVHDCRRAHIKVAMVTGDHPETASVLAGELGIARHGISRPADHAVTGSQLAEANEKGDEEFDALVASSGVFARVAPRQKMEIVQSYIKRGEFVAVTGDGINDAPALKHAHIGISMGKRGSDMARESSDMILTDDNFASIVQGVKQGRIVYNNIRKVIFLLISTGAAEITLIMLSILSGLPLPLLPLQLLWLNLVTNGIQDVALVFEPEEGNELSERPRDPNEPIFNRLMIERVAVNAVIMGCLAFAVFYWQIQQGVDEVAARNVTLLLMVLFENVHVFNSRSEKISIFRQNFFGNPFLLFGMLAAQGIHILAMHTPGLRDVLGIEPVSFELWSQLLLISLLLVVVDELHKFWHLRFASKTDGSSHAI